VKEKSFRFRESFSRAIRPMTDKQAGQLIKGLCDYAFEDKAFESSDGMLKSTFALVSDAIINVIKKLIQTDKEEEIDDIANGYITMLKDLSCFSSANIFGILTFDKTDLIKLFELEAYLIKLSNQDVVKRPMRGVVKLTLRNWILKSRNNYNSNYLYKCISNKSANNALSNHEVWMQKIENLNDKRENKVIKELYKNKSWIKYCWAKNVRFKQLNDSFVCSYSKIIPTPIMQSKYGSNVFGYKSDRIADVLAPIALVKGHPFLDQVACYDILYSQNEAKEEINYLCELINLFEMSETDKNIFLNDMLEYWYLSIKDKKWGYEHERRYQLFVFNYKDYTDISTDDRFLKIKSSVYLYPDFIFSNSPIKYRVALYRTEKLYSIAMRDYIYCHNCLQADFDNVTYCGIDNKTCSICDSKDIEVFRTSS